MPQPQHVSLGEPERKVITEFGVFNDPEVWNPLFASGEIPEEARFQVEQPLHVGESLWHVYRFAALRNEERALQDKIGKYGHVIIKKRDVPTPTPWENVSHEEIDEVRRG